MIIRGPAGAEHGVDHTPVAQQIDVTFGDVRPGDEPLPKAMLEIGRLLDILRIQQLLPDIELRGSDHAVRVYWAPSPIAVAEDVSMMQVPVKQHGRAGVASSWSRRVRACWIKPCWLCHMGWCCDTSSNALIH